MNIFSFVISHTVIGTVHTAVHKCTVPLLNRKLFISGSCSTLVLTTVPCQPRHTDTKSGAKDYQGPTPSRENVIRKYHFSHTFFQILS